MIRRETPTILWLAEQPRHEGLRVYRLGLSCGDSILVRLGPSHAQPALRDELPCPTAAIGQTCFADLPIPCIGPPH